MPDKPDTPTPNESGAHGKPISLHPMSVEEALRKAMQADPKPDDPKPKKKQG